jgi:hypothetical protein
MIASTTRRAARGGGGLRSGPRPVVPASRHRLSEEVAEAIKNWLIEDQLQPGVSSPSAAALVPGDVTNDVFDDVFDDGEERG